MKSCGALKKIIGYSLSETETSFQIRGEENDQKCTISWAQKMDMLIASLSSS